MSTSIQLVKLAFVDVSDADQRPLKSVLNSATRLLNAEFDWTDPERADICIVDVHGQSSPPEQAVALRFSSHRNGVPVDLARPFRTRDLLEVFRQALKDVAFKSAHHGRSGVGVRVYRGAIVE